MSRYFIELAQALSKLDNIDVKVKAPIHFNHHLWKSVTREKSVYLPYSSDFLRLNQRVRRISNAISQIYVADWKPDLIHETFYSAEDLWKYPKPRITTIHDLIREKDATSYAKLDKKRNSIYRSHGIICVSDSTRNDLLNYYKLNEENVHRVYVGVNPRIWVNDKIPLSRSKEFVLFVGQRDGYKNFKILLEAFSESKILRSNFDIVAFGGNEFKNSEKEEIASFGLTKNVLHKRGDDASLSRMYRTAKLFVSTSTIEGFGSPNLEAMSSGCPVLCSDISAFKESAGAAAHYFDPKSAESLRNSLEELVCDQVRLEDLARAGLKHAKSFTWEKCALETKAVYELYRSN